MSYLKRSFLFLLLLAAVGAGFKAGKSLKIEYSGKIVDCQGVAALRPPMGDRWTPLAVDMFADKGDLIRTDPRGANAVQIRLSSGGSVIVGPGSLVELVDGKTLKVTRGEIEFKAPDKGSLKVLLPGKKKKAVKKVAVLRVTENSVEKLAKDPAWLKYFKGSIAREPMGSLLAKVEGRNLPLTLGYHKVTVDIRDQIARTTIEESFVNNTRSTLEGVFHFPLPQDASISGFGMWIGDELVEADVVEKQRARQIYETILREKRDPGLLEWSGGNIFKARVFPIFPHSEKRIKITYTQVLPMEGGKYRYSYALQSEMLKQHPLRELAVNVRVYSDQPLKSVECTSHETRSRTTKNSAQVEFSAQEYTPNRDFELVVETGKRPEVVVIPHRRGDDGYFLLQIAQPGSGRKGKRALIGDGPPLDLIVMVDTSASMDAGQRRLQEEFIATLMGSLGEKDKLRVAAVDMDCHWITADDSGSVRDFLANRASLGMTDLEKVFGKVFEKASSSTHIIYLGDAVDTTGEADPVDAANRLKRLYKASGKGTVHAVATGSSFESGIMKAIAGASGGSTRRLQGKTPARSGVVEVLEELTNPGIREMKVKFSGVRTARVYPDELPNLPAGKQQIVIGRYLPDGNDQKGEVTVTGVYKGRSVKYSAPFVVKDAESGNSFIPRLWARMHLERLLAEGRTPEIKDEIVALSEEYHIMTPYTSFLVLESDADRERFKVKKRFTMRDGEKFFAEGRDKANYQLRQKYMQMAGKWRQDIRRDVLRELLDLARQRYDYIEPYPAGRLRDYSGSYGYDGGMPLYAAKKGGSFYRSYPMFGKSEGFRGSPSASDGMDLMALDEAGGSEEDVDGFFDDDASELPAETAPFAEPEPEEEMLSESLALDPALNRADRESKKVVHYGGKAKELRQQFVYTDSQRARSYNRRNYGGWANAPVDGVTSLDSVSRMSSPLLSKLSRKPALHSGPYGQRWQPHWNGWIEQLFPPLSLPPEKTVVTPAAGRNEWPEAAKALAESLLRKPFLEKMDGALEFDVSSAAYTAREEMNRESNLKMLFSKNRWIGRSHRSQNRTLVSWHDGRHIAAYAPCFKLGRQRKAVKEDGEFRFYNFYYFKDHSLLSLWKQYRSYTAVMEEKGKGRVLLSLEAPNHPNKRKVEFIIDTERNVVLEERTQQDGTVINRTVFSKFTKAGGCWWAGRIESRDKDGVLGFRTTLSVKDIAEADFNKKYSDMLPVPKESVFVDHPLPDYEQARQARLDGEMDLAHYLSMISFYSQTQQADKSKAVWNEASETLNGRLGHSWINLAVHIQMRRYEEARLMVNAKSRNLAGSRKNDDDLFVANHLFNYLQTFGQINERIDLLDILKPVFSRQKKYLKAETGWKQKRANALAQAGRYVEALEIWEELVKLDPSNTGYAISYVSAMTQNAQLEEAYKWLNERLRRKGYWNDQERESVRSSVFYYFENRIDVEKLLTFLKEWIDEETSNQYAYQKYIENLYRVKKIEEANRLIEKWVDDALKYFSKRAPDANPPVYNSKEWKKYNVVTVRLQGAIHQILGYHRGYGHRNLEPRWHDLLTRLVRDGYRTKGLQVYANQVMTHHLFHRLDEAAELRKEFKKVVFAESGTLEPQLLSQLVVWIGYNNPKVEKKEWTALADLLEKRWSIDKEKSPAERDTLGSTLVTVLNYAGDSERVTQFLRKQWKSGPELFRQRYLQQLHTNLLNKPWTEDNETELFALIGSFVRDMKESEVPDLSDYRVDVTLPVLMRVADRMIPARTAATMEKVEGKDDLSRIEYRKLARKHKKMAREGLVARLKEEAEKQIVELRPWVDIERLYLEMKLGKDPDRIAAVCWKLLPENPPACKLKKKEDERPPVEPYPVPMPRKAVASGKPDERKDLTILEAGMIDRCLTTLSCLAAKQSADRKLVDRVIAYIDRGIELNPDVEYWRYQKYRLLVGRNEAEPLEAALKGWITPDKADDTWRLALGYLVAEMNRVEEAVKLFEQIEKNDGLGSKDYEIMAGWYMVLDQKDKHEKAALKKLMVLNENELSRKLNVMMRPWNRRGSEVPEELDPEAVKILTVLLKKSRYPSNYTYQLSRFYRQTKDFRLLECMSEGVIGHTAQRVYPYVGGLRNFLNSVNEEAAVDTAMEHLEKVRAKAGTRIDNRALDIIEMLLRRRAAAVDNQPGPHIEKALAAMKRAFKGEWQTGERRLMADLLYNLGHMKSKELKAEQMRELKELAAVKDEPAQDRLHINLQYARMLYRYNMKNDALDVLESILDEYKAKHDGRLPQSARNVFDQYIGYLSSMKKFMRAETLINVELKVPANKRQEYWLIQRRFRLYNEALYNRGTVSFGSGQQMYEKVLDLYISEMERSDQNHRHQIISYVSTFFRNAKRVKVNTERLRPFAFKVFPKFLESETNQYNYQSHVSSIGYTVKEILGARAALEFLIVMIEDEPEWLKMTNHYSAWNRHGYQLGQYRAQAKDIGSLEPRLLRLVKDALRRDLKFRRGHSRTIYWRSNYFWAEKADDFTAVADEVWEEQKNSGEAALYISNYLWDGLRRRQRAVELLRYAYSKDYLHQGGMSTFASRLHHLGLFKESIPVLQKLVKLSPGSVDYRVRLMTAFSRTGQDGEVRKVLEAADEYFHQPAMWVEGNLYQLAKGCLNVKYYKEAIEYYKELIPMHKRSRPNRGVGSHQLSMYYREMADTYAGLKMTAEAVDAASGAVVVWGRTHRNRADALRALDRIIQGAPDLDTFVVKMEKDAEESGLENPILRKAVGKAYQKKGEHKNAIRHLRVAMESQPNDAETHRAIVQAYDKMGDKAGAAAQLLNSVKLSRRDIALYRDLGNRYSKQLNRPVDAERAYASIVEMLPNESESHTMLAEIRQRQERWDDAIHHWRQVIRVRTLEPTGLLRLAGAQISAKKFDDARASIKELESKSWPERFRNLKNDIRNLKRRLPIE